MNEYEKRNIPFVGHGDSIFISQKEKDKMDSFKDKDDKIVYIKKLRFNIRCRETDPSESMQNAIALIIESLKEINAALHVLKVAVPFVDDNLEIIGDYIEILDEEYIDES